MTGARDYRRTAALAQAVGVRRIDTGVYTARRGRWRLVRVRPGLWTITDSHGGHPTMTARTLYTARCAVGAAENTPTGRIRP